MVSTPVLFLIFNRPDNTAEVFSKIKLAKPAKLFIAADGARADKVGEWEKCEETRRIVTKIDWDCEVITLFRDKNLGCKVAVSQAINWFFSQVEYGIILEDDCVPDLSFFSFCEAMLVHYQHDTRIMMVAGTNYLSAQECLRYKNGYFFSNYYPIWGWATWRRAWNMYDVELKAWPEKMKTNELRWQFPHKKIAAYYTNMFNLIVNGFNTWDIQWWFACIFQHGLCIMPGHNLVSNIGTDGTHSDTQNDFAIRMPVLPLSMQSLSHPQMVYPDHDLNKLLYQKSHAGLFIDFEKDDIPFQNISSINMIKLNIKRVFRKVIRLQKK